ncbi:GGDEF domain-containing protein [Pseudomonas sp. HAR-UPW-AIA-41]|nr:GGDEF domain-containing protein [Pseudomonas sp. HAR-UPW-AIA-41]
MRKPLLTRLLKLRELDNTWRARVQQENLKRLYFLALFGVLLSLSQIVLFWLLDAQGSAREARWREISLLVHPAILLLSLLIGGLTLRLRHLDNQSEAVELLSILTATLVLAVGLMLTAFDQLVIQGVTPLVTACSITALLLYLRPLTAFALFSSALFISLLIINELSPSPAQRLSSTMNSITACASGLLVSWILYRNFLREQQLRKVLLRQRETLKARTRQLQFQATHDTLTGLFNRREFERLTENELSRVNRHPAPLSLLMLDLDHFKAINDNFGHPAGDAVIRHVARLLSEHTRNCDTIGRLGGEEFIILLPETDLPQAQQTAEKLRGLIEHSAIDVDNGRLRITASVGLACLAPGCQTDLSPLYLAADQALYRAKRAGRNRVEHFYFTPSAPDLSSPPLS